jgi:hypothetical protein
MDTIKDHYLYPLYLEYLKDKSLTHGAFELTKISQQYFFQFKIRYDTDDGFKDKQDRVYRITARQNKIDDILNDKLL